jgi:hypothetical protein
MVPTANVKLVFPGIMKMATEYQSIERPRKERGIQFGVGRLSILRG